MNAPTLEQLQKQVQHLDLHSATAALLEHLNHSGNGDATVPGRFKVLQEVIGSRPAFRQALLDGNKLSIAREWADCLKAYAGDARFLHTLAVLYREHALAQSNRNGEAGTLWLLSTGLWALLLCSTEFWRYFSEARFFDGESTRRALDEGEQMALWEDALRGILALHSTCGHRDFATGQFNRAQAHLRCLSLCRQGADKLVIALTDEGLPCTLKVDKARTEQLVNLADELLDDWCSILVRGAEKAAQDAEAIQQLPEGIRVNYEGGIRELQPFIELNIPVVRILRASLHWYNDWCYDLYVTRQIDRIKELMKPARQVAEQLIPLCITARGHLPENAELSRHFLLRGFSADDPQQAVKEYESALAWNPANDNAAQLLGDSRQAVLMRQLDTAIECMKENKFKEAYEVLDAVEAHAEDKQRVQQARSVVCFHHADALADEGKFREALTRARESNRLQPNHPVIQKFITKMEELAPEEDNLRHLRTAQEEWERKRYDHVIEKTAKVGRSSKFNGQARQLQSGAYFHRGITAATAEHFAEATADLERALQCNDNKEERKIITEQLEQVREGDNFKLLRAAQEAIDQGRFQDAAGFAAQVPQASKLYGQARHLQSFAWFRRGVEAANRNDFPDAESSLECALALNEKRDEKKSITEQLAAVLNAHACSLVSEAQAAEKEFGQAIADIMAKAKLMQGQ